MRWIPADGQSCEVNVQLSMAIGMGEGGESQAPMGRAVIGGLITSTLLTLVAARTSGTLDGAVGGVSTRCA